MEEAELVRKMISRLRFPFSVLYFFEPFDGFSPLYSRCTK